jgi:thiamine biosynthesis lipoprotein
VEARRLAFKAMGCPCELRLHPAQGVDVDAALFAARDEILRLEAKYSRYRDDSLASRINRSAGSGSSVEVDEETAALLDYAAIAHDESDGLFDPTSGILRRAWNFRSGRLPSQDALEELLGAIGWEKLEWERPLLALPLPGMELDFGGFVKEYAADRVAEMCRQLGIRSGLVDLGGDLAVVGPHPDGSPWRVGIRDPHHPERAIAVVALAAGAIATSGDYERCMLVNGRRYGHVLDPRSGWPVEGLTSATVSAPHCLVAGTASTVALLKGEHGAAWLDGLGLPHLRVDREGDASGSLARGAAPRSISAADAPQAPA